MPGSSAARSCWPGPIVAWCVGIIILLSGLPVIIKQLVRYDLSVGLAPNVASLGGQVLTTGATGLFLVLIGLITEPSRVEAEALNPWLDVVAGMILLMVGVMVTAVWRGRRNQEKRIGRAGAHSNSVDLH